jgi:hypothetical protein
MNYRTCFWIATALCTTAWAVTTGLSIEKVLVDGVRSWTLLLAMPVFVAAVAFLIHLAFEDFRSWRVIRALVGLSLAALTLTVTLPNSIGSSGSAKDAEVAQAQASGRGLAFSESMLTAAKNDLDDAKKYVMAECLGAPEVIEPGMWPKCSWWRRQVEAHTLAVEKYGKGVVDAPVETKALSGESRIAWALSAIGTRVPEQFAFSVTETDLTTALPMAPPLAGELLCAFFGFMALEFRKLARREEEEAAARKAAQANLTSQIVTSSEPKVEPVMVPTRVSAPSEPEVPAVEPETVEEPVEEPAVVITPDPETPPPSGNKRRKRVSKKELRKARVFSFGESYFARHGQWPSTGKIAGQFHLPAATASSYRKQMMAA